MSAKQATGVVRRVILAPLSLTLFAIGLLLTLPTVSNAGLYTTTYLGTLGGPSYAWGINNAGDVVGFYGSGPQHAFLYKGGVMTDIGTLNGAGGQTQALAINNNGQIVGIGRVDFSAWFKRWHGRVTALAGERGASAPRGRGPAWGSVLGG